MKTPDADLLREMIGFAVQRLMELEVEGLTGAGYGEKSPERLAQCNGYRDRDWEPEPAQAAQGKLLPRFPRFLEARRMAEKALSPQSSKKPTCTASLRVRSIFGQGHGHERHSKSQVSRLCSEIDQKVKAFLSRPIEGNWPIRFPWSYALTQQMPAAQTLAMHLHRG
jgi:putative transposase